MEDPGEVTVNNVDYCVIGGGIMGVALAREIAHRRPEASVLVLDKEAGLGMHASGRNSGVLHAGFYYAPDSLKARLTARGNHLLRTFCASKGVTVRACGKVVVATDAAQLPALDQLVTRGRANGVRLEAVDEAGLSEIEPLARTVDRAIWSPDTAVADPASVMAALREDLEAARVTIRTGAMVTSAHNGVVTTQHGLVSAGHIVNAAGLHADVVGGWFGFCDDYVMLPFKGLYWYGGPGAPALRHHVYPVPDPRNPFLGVHFTVTVDGGVKVGPTAIPVLWREAYGGLFRFDRQEAASIVRAYPRFLGSDHHDVPALIRSEVPKYSRRYLVAQARRLVPSADYQDFPVKGRAGIRAQLMRRSTGALEMDFVVRGDQASTHVLNAVSPAWTSSLAFAEYVVDDMHRRAAI
jgi:L-2-hydroxyglutarate oxidase LhgO